MGLWNDFSHEMSTVLMLRIMEFLTILGCLRRTPYLRTEPEYLRSSSTYSALTSVRLSKGERTRRAHVSTCMALQPAGKRKRKKRGLK